MAKFTKATAASYGSKGGKRTFEKHGRDHMSRIGLRGFWRTVERHWQGNPHAFVNYLIMMGIAATDPVPHNDAFIHDRFLMRSRALSGAANYLCPFWRPPAIPTDLAIEPPF